jgi:hypothetical protein
MMLVKMMQSLTFSPQYIEIVENIQYRNESHFTDFRLKQPRWMNGRNWAIGADSPFPASRTKTSDPDVTPFDAIVTHNREAE